jgi:long-chain acyl-CoA synthetase
LKAVPGVADTVVVGMPTEDGAQVHAVMILEPEMNSRCEEADPDAIVRQANSHLAPHQFIKGYTVWPDKEFPRTHTLKVKKHEVLARLQEMRVQKEPVKEPVAAAGAP